MRRNLFSRVIVLKSKTTVNGDFINDRVRRFLRTQEFDSQYISLKLMRMTVDFGERSEDGLY